MIRPNLIFFQCSISSLLDQEIIWAWERHVQVIQCKAYRIKAMHMLYMHALSDARMHARTDN
jgi:hypothetical protein